VKDINWNRRGQHLLTLGLVCIPASYIPWFGALFFLPFSDLILLAVSAFIVGLVSFRNGIRGIRLQIGYGLFLLVWFVLSLIRELPYLPGLISGTDSSSKPLVKIHQPILVEGLKTIAVEGDANPLLAARGRSGDFAPEINVAGMRVAEVNSIANRPTQVDVLDRLWYRGFVPEIGVDTFPKIRIRTLNREDSFDVDIQVLSAPDKVAGTYTRTLNRPPAYPGIKTGVAINLFKSIFYLNLWRTLLDRNIEVNLPKEIDEFLNAVLVSTKQSDQRFGPLQMLSISSDRVVNHEGEESAPAYLRKKNSVNRKDPDHEAAYWDICNIRPMPLNVGSPGFDSNFWTVPAPTPPAYFLLRENSSWNRTRGFYCDIAKPQIIVFSNFDEKPPNLKVAVFSLSGKPDGVYYFQLPFWLANGAFVLPGSWSITKTGVVSFTVMQTIEIIRPTGDRYNDPKNYRVIEFTTGNS
jgi:hypothetical protein